MEYDKAATGLIAKRLELAVEHYRVGRWREAGALYRQILQADPDHAEALYGAGLILCQTSHNDTAVGLFSKAISVKPGDAKYHYSLGLALLAQRRLDDAVASFRKALALKPDWPEACYKLANALMDLGRLDEAAASYQEALRLKPEFAEASGNLGSALKGLGRLDEARACFEQSMALKPSNGLRVTSALMLPPIMGSKAELLASRARFEQNLDRLIAEKVTLADPVKEGCATNFYLAFQGFNDRDLQKKVARFYAQACPSLLWVAPHCGSAKPVGRKIRVGFISKYIFRHSVSLSYRRIVKDLARRAEFEVTLISTRHHEEESAREMFGGFTGKHLHLPHDLARAREQVAALELDFLVYLDIGMDPFGYFLAFSRLARAQCVLGGHPVTTGIAAVDFAISNALNEPADADSHYSETLVRLPSGVSYYERPALPTALKTRKELGLPQAGRLYLCPMALQKIHPDFDEALARILQLDGNGQVVMFADKRNSAWQRLLEKRFDRTIPASVRTRIVFLPWVGDSLDFLRVNEAADVILDPFHFGIGSTSTATFSVGTPIVTKPGEFRRGRMGLSRCRSMDVMECVALDTEDYARKAVAIATDRALREKIKSKILANNHVLFENSQAVMALADFFLDPGKATGV